jgi:YD repeat-containing protein
MKISFDNQVVLRARPAGPIIEGWQKLEGEFTVPTNVSNMQLEVVNSHNKPVYLDDVRMHPFNANMKSYVYDPLNLRLAAELDENNHATFFEYDDEGQLVRVKKETIQGIKTIKETRTAKQKSIHEIL